MVSFFSLKKKWERKAEKRGKLKIRESLDRRARGEIKLKEARKITKKLHLKGICKFRLKPLRVRQRSIPLSKALACLN